MTDGLKGYAGYSDVRIWSAAGATYGPAAVLCSSVSPVYVTAVSVE
ncbi:hypothetical protein E5083_09515 [Streptomyces bauhiniae]|uniref:Uncharacterized protein n=1 Tax=Streptomyces bauhiniae TaxID=2340725 RepID=A0A4Z1DB70_9ACTN|nr:hypothetical protein E5083_09515 [Streptomyces bauhiniae]